MHQVNILSYSWYFENSSTEINIVFDFVTSGSKELIKQVK